MICTEKKFMGKQTVIVCKIELVNMQEFSEVDRTSKQLTVRLICTRHARCSWWGGKLCIIWLNACMNLLE